MGQEPSGTELGCVAKKCPRRHSRKYVLHLSSAAMKKRKKEKDFCFVIFWTIRCIILYEKDYNTWAFKPTDQENSYSLCSGWGVFMRSNGALSWNTVSMFIYTLWDNISSCCWLFDVYIFHSFIMQIQFALQKQVPSGIQKNGCGVPTSCCLSFSSKSVQQEIWWGCFLFVALNCGTPPLGSLDSRGTLNLLFDFYTRFNFNCCHCWCLVILLLYSSDHVL